MKVQVSQLAVALCASLASATTINEITGIKFHSPLVGQAVTNVSGLVTAKATNGFYLRSTTPDNDPRSSDSVFVFGAAVVGSVSVGDIITLDGTVAEFRSASRASDVKLTEITGPKNIVKVSSGNAVVPKIIGKDTAAPPREQFTSLDNGDVFSLPNNQSLISVVNPTLEPTKYGMDFWESLSGELVTIKGASALVKPNNFFDTWVTGDWKVTGRNKRGGLTMTDKDSNPETVTIVGTALDGTKNPATTKMGDTLEDITGVVTYAFGYYSIAPLTAIKITGSKQPAVAPATTLISGGTCKDITIGSYNVENLDPSDAHLPKIADHIVNVLKAPTLVFLQEVQDNNGATNDGTVSSNLTLSTLVTEISKLTSVEYDFTDISPVNNQDGGEPGGNIRVAYLYQKNVIRLRKPNPGSSTDATEVTGNLLTGGPSLKFNPGRIAPADPAWTASRKPLVALWEFVAGGKHPFWTVNVHFGSKGGSSPITGDARPPVNGGVEDRLAQATLTGNFIREIMKKDPLAKIITAGDFNEFAFVKPFEEFKKLSLQLDLDVVALIPKEERYTYAFDMNTQQLDHSLISPAIAAKLVLNRVKYEHLHVSTWASKDDMVSDHDPSVAKLDVCSLL